MRAILVAGIVLFAVAQAFAAPLHDTSKFITPPARWTRETLTGSKTAALGFLLVQWFTDARGDEEFIELGKRPSNGFTDESFRRYYEAELREFGDKVTAYRPQSLCHGERGWYVQHHEGTTRGDIIEDVYVIDRDAVYFASYHYPKTLPESKVARHSIESLCVPSVVAAPPLKLPFLFTPPRGWLVSDVTRAGGQVVPGEIAIYVEPGRFSQAIVLYHFDDDVIPVTTSESAKQAVEEKRDGITLKSAPVIELKKLCGDHVGWLATYRAKLHGRAVIAESLVLPGPAISIATYVRDAGTPPSAQARAALETLCPN